MMTTLNATHDAARRSWLASANAEGADFPIQNLPLGMFSLAGEPQDAAPRPGVAIGDQVVTAIGVAHCAGMKGAAAVDQVNLSNWSKFTEDGEPIFNETGKIAKGPRYMPPNLDGLT